MVLRRYESSDLKEIADLFYNTVHYVNIKDYSLNQLNAWAPGNIDFTLWHKTLLDHYSIVAVKDGIIVGFGDISTDGYLDRLYVHKDYQRQGIATAICVELENSVYVDKIITYSSITAIPFFLVRGYRIVKKQVAIRNGIPLVNYFMEKS